jgi:hypothetical protein
MDMVLASTSIKPSKVKFVNYCRLYLRFLTESGICNAAGTELAEGILTGYRHHSQTLFKLAVLFIWRIRCGGYPGRNVGDLSGLFIG